MTTYSLIALLASAGYVNAASITSAGSWNSASSWQSGEVPTFDQDLNVDIEATTAIVTEVDAAIVANVISLKASAVDSTLKITDTLSCVRLDFAASATVDMAASANAAITSFPIVGSATGGIDISAGVVVFVEGSIDFSSLISPLVDTFLKVDGASNKAVARGTSLKGVTIQATNSAAVEIGAKAEASAEDFFEWGDNLAFDASSGATISIEEGARVQIDANADVTFARGSASITGAVIYGQEDSSSTNEDIIVEGNASLEVTGAGKTSAMADVRVTLGGGSSNDNFYVRSGSTLDVIGDVTVRADGSGSANAEKIIVESSAALAVKADSVLDAASNVVLDARSSAEVTVEQGSRLALAGATFAADTALEVGVNAAAATTAVVEVAGNAALSGALSIVADGSAGLTAGSEYKVVAYGSASGSFDSVSANGRVITELNAGAGAGRRLLDNGEDHYEVRDDGVYYIPARDSPAFLATPTWALSAAGVALASYLMQ